MNREIEAYLRRETDKAWGIANPRHPGEIIWLPKSQCEIKSVDGKIVIMTVPGWLLKKNGWL